MNIREVMQKYSKKTGGENLEEGFVKKQPPKIENPLLANTLLKKDACIFYQHVLSYS